MVVTDAQVHVWPADHPDRPWPAGGHDYAHRAEYLPEELLADMAAAGVHRAVLVPPSFAGDGNDLCLAAARAHPDRFAVMGRLGLRDPGARDALAGWRDQPGMLGLRMTFGRGLAAAPDDPDLRWFWAGVVRHRIPVMVSASAYLDRIPRLLDAHPGLRLVIDRLGVPHPARGAAIDAALDRLCALARYDTLAVKATGLPELGDRPEPRRSVRRRLHRVLDAFGARRVFWASDLTRMPCDYPAVLALCADLLADRPAGEREWVLGRGVSTWLGWPVTPTPIDAVPVKERPQR